MFLTRFQQPTSGSVGRSVCDDWIRALPGEKNDIFDSIVRHWECSFAMMSVSLNEAFSMRARGELVCARQQASMSAALMTRLSVSLVSFCESLAKRGRYVRHVPTVEPLNPEFFRGNTGRNAATWNGILHYVVFGNRPRFVQKLRILSSTLDQLNREFCKAANNIAIARHSSPDWSVLDALHYDFTTCLRETEVVFKSFLRALPMDQLAAFVGEVQTPQPKRIRLRFRPSRASASA